MSGRFVSRIACCAILAVGLSGCGSSAVTRYHALTPVEAGDQIHGNATGPVRMVVEILPIAMPERINREEVVLMSANGVDVRDGDHWVAPLPDEIRHLVADALWRRDGAADDYKAPLPSTTSHLPTYRLSLRIERFEAGAARPARVEGSWTLRPLPEGTASVCRAVFSESNAGGTTASAVASLSQASSHLADAIAVSLERMSQGSRDACP